MESASFFLANGQINLDRFTPNDFEAFLADKRRTVSISTFNGYRSAIKDLYRRSNLPLPDEYKGKMVEFYSGLKRLQASRLQSGAPRDSVKDPVPYSLYRDLCMSTLTRQDSGFAHLFLTTQWNLMSRSQSVEALCTEHFAAHDDSIGCIIYQSKTNQEGKGRKDPRHLYASVLSPVTCWITSLAIYLACRPTQKTGLLFCGAKQKTRYGNVLRQLVKEIKCGNDYRTHSIRKGVATFACSGTTGGASIASVCLRVGWSLGGVQDRYIRYESAGDQYLGRVVAGLPLNGSAFAALPTLPTITTVSWAQRHQTCLAHSPHPPTRRYRKALSRVTHLPLSACTKTHPLLSTVIFRTPDLMEQLRNKMVPVKDLLRQKSPWMKSTGIPPHIELYHKLDLLQVHWTSYRQHFEMIGQSS